MTKKGLIVPGQRVALHDREGEITQVSEQCVVIRLGNQSRKVDRHTFQSMQLAGGMRYLQPDEFVAQSQRNDNPPLRSKGQIKAATRRAAYVDALQAEPENPCSQPVRAEVIRRVAAEISDPAPPALSTVHAWFKRFRSAGCSYDVLYDRTHGRGNRQPKLAPAVRELIALSIDRDYLIRECPSMEHAYHVGLLRRCKAAGVEAPSYRTYCRHIDEVDIVHRTRRRHGEAAARALARTNRGGLITSRVLERVELDGTLLDIVVLTDCGTMILGRPYIILLRDHYSGVITGFHLGFGSGESAIATIHAIESSIKPKTQVLQSHPTVRSQWLAYGIMELLVMDAGPGFQSDDTQEFASSLGFSVMSTQVRMPWMKGAVESVFGYIRNALYAMPGAVHKSDPGQAERLNAYREACITESVFREMLTRWIVDVHNQKPCKEHVNPAKIGRSPNDIWRESVASQPPLEPAAYVSYAHFGTKRHECSFKVGRGLRAHALNWHSDELLELQQRLGKGVKMTLRVNPDDLGTGWVEDPINQRLIKVHSHPRAYTGGLSLAQHEAIRRHARQRYRRHPSHAELLEARQELHDLAKAAQEILRAKATKTGRPQRRPADLPLYLDRNAAGGIPDDDALHAALTQSFRAEGSRVALPIAALHEAHAQEEPPEPPSGDWLIEDLDDDYHLDIED